jgi:hypothetical protein
MEPLTLISLVTTALAFGRQSQMEMVPWRADWRARHGVTRMFRWGSAPHATWTIKESIFRRGNYRINCYPTSDFRDVLLPVLERHPWFVGVARNQSRTACVRIWENRDDSVLPEFSDPGRAMVIAQDLYLLAVSEFPNEEKLYVLDALGPDAAIRMDQLLEQTGWR